MNVELVIECGKTTDDFNLLETLCKEKAEQLAQTIQISEQDTISIPFWTTDFPEMICVGLFYKNKNGEICFELDFSQSTM